MSDIHDSSKKAEFFEKLAKGVDNENFKVPLKSYLLQRRKQIDSELEDDNLPSNVASVSLRVGKLSMITELMRKFFDEKPEERDK